jgi:hypothetical protein
VRECLCMRGAGASSVVGESDNSEISSAWFAVILKTILWSWLITGLQLIKLGVCRSATSFLKSAVRSGCKFWVGGASMTSIGGTGLSSVIKDGNVSPEISSAGSAEVLESSLGFFGTVLEKNSTKGNSLL